MYLEVDSGSQDRKQSGDAIDCQERKAVLIDAKHHLKAACHRLDVVVVLCQKNKQFNPVLVKLHPLFNHTKRKTVYTEKTAACEEEYSTC